MPSAPAAFNRRAQAIPRWLLSLHRGQSRAHATPLSNSAPGCPDTPQRLQKSFSERGLWNLRHCVYCRYATSSLRKAAGSSRQKAATASNNSKQQQQAAAR